MLPKEPVRSVQKIPFDKWKEDLYANARILNQDQHLCHIEDRILVLFWAEGCGPTVRDIISSGANATRKPVQPAATGSTKLASNQ